MKRTDLLSKAVICTVVSSIVFCVNAEFKTASEPKHVPELMVTAAGEKVDSVEKWEKVRRGEILKTFKEEFYGVRPVERPADLKFVEIAPGVSVEIARASVSGVADDSALAAK